VESGRHGRPRDAGGHTSRARDINARGQIVGESETARGDTHALLWQSGTMRDLGTLGGSSSAAAAINDDGQIAGLSTNAAGVRRAVVWSPSGETVSLSKIGDVTGARTRRRR
jgi:probable HAF family extracellular repeat protein